MNIKVALETNEIAGEGIDQTAVISDIEAEINKLTKLLEVKVKRTDTPAPAEALGEFEFIEWVFQVATDPEMALVYGKALIFAINQILEANKKKSASDKEKDERFPVSIKVFGKTIALPTTTAVIRKFLKSIGEE